jgi:VIT1/CCC1 family predicted Fe2+/Mn2+ transporter
LRIDRGDDGRGARFTVLFSGTPETEDLRSGMQSGKKAICRLSHHSEKHLVDRIGWLRAAVLGANDGIISTASLIVGVAAAAAKQNDVLIAGVAGLVARAMSMAAG